MSQPKPSEPVNRKVVCQPNLNCNQTISGGARIDPTQTPLLKIPMPIARWRAGNHSATTRAAPGQLPASPTPSRKRKQLRLTKPRANACAEAAMDQIKIEKVNPRRG